MTHLPFIAASYGLAALVLVGFSVSTWLRLGAARRRLAAIDPRRGAKSNPSRAASSNKDAP